MTDRTMLGDEGADASVAPGAADEARAASAVRGAAGVRRFLESFAVFDWLAVGFLSLPPLALALLGAPFERCVAPMARHLALLAVVAAGVVAGRWQEVHRSYFVGALYRTVLVAAMSVTYVLLGESLPLINPRVLDLPLYHLDLHLFGVEPAILFERWATPVTTDWFSFFYMGYFGILFGFLIPMVFFGRCSALTAELGFTVLFVYGVGQTFYALVPGFGPLHALTEAFHRELPGGPIFHGMHAFVSDAGAKKDIFPSLHTGIPTALSLLAFRYRREIGPWWVAVGFVTVNTIVATMFLRWHYLVDVIAGLFLAFGTVTLSARVLDWELARRARAGLPALWPVWPGSERR